MFGCVVAGVGDLSSFVVEGIIRILFYGGGVKRSNLSLTFPVVFICLFFCLFFLSLIVFTSLSLFLSLSIYV